MKVLRKRKKVHMALFLCVIMFLQMIYVAFVPNSVEAAAGGSSISTEITGGVTADVFDVQPGGENNWYLVGSFCDWNNKALPFSHLVGDFYAYSIVLDTGTHKFKLTKNGTWDGFNNSNNNDDSNNFVLTLEEKTKVNFYINDEINEARINVSGVEELPQYTPTLSADKWPRLVGDIQSIFNESQWDPPSAEQYFVDYYFNSTVYKLQRSIPAGEYGMKVVFGSNWDENYGNKKGENVKLVTLDPTDVTFTIDYSAEQKVLSHDYVAGDYDGVIQSDAIYFDSQSITYKKPFGAIPQGEQDLTLRIAAQKDDAQIVRVEMINEEGLAKTYDMKKVTSVEGLDYYEVTIPAIDFDHIGVWGYRFILIDGPTKVEYGDDSVRGGTGRAMEEGAVPFDLTVYAPDFHTPDWMKNAIVYQIFPDRFFDGYEGNNRAKVDDGYRGNRDENKNTEPIIPHSLQYFDGGVMNDPTPSQVWGEWSDIPEMPDRCTVENAPYYPDAKTDGVWTNEFYGGDIQGVQAKLNYLESIGVTAIYFNPIAWAGSNHKYDATDYKHLDPMFGEPVYNTPGDPASGLDYDATRKASDAIFIQFANEAKDRGIHIITDGVFNHVGDDSIYFDRYEKYPEIGAYEYWAKVYNYVNDDGMTLEDAKQTAINSFTSLINPATGVNYKYPEDFEFTTWFTIHNKKVISGDNVAMYDYDAWWGYDSLPAMDAIEPVEGDKDAISGVHEWNVESYRNHVIGYDLSSMTEEEQQEAMKHTASQVWNWMGASGWRLDVAPDVSFGTWEKFRQAVKSQKGLKNVNDETIDDPIILGEEWGVATHYLLGNQFDSVMNYRFRGALQTFLTGGSAQDLHAALESVREDYPKEAWQVMLNLVGSHDTTRNITKMDYPEYEENRIGIAPKATDKAFKLQALTAIFQMGYPGAPTIYYGDEVGMEGTKDPDCRRTFPWERISETDGEFTGAGDYADLFYVYQKAAKIRHDHDVFKTGDIKVAYAQGNVIAYARRNTTKAGLVIINKGEEAQTIQADVTGFIPDGIQFSDQLNETIQSTVTDGKLTITMPALTGLMMVNDGELKEIPTVKDVDVDPGNAEVSLYWNSVEGAEGYNVYRAPIEGGALTLLSKYQTDLSYVDNDVINGIKYYYAVTAVIGNSESDILNMVSATPAFPVNRVAISQYIDDMTIGVGKTTETAVAIEVKGLTDAEEHAGVEAPNLIARLAYYLDSNDKEEALNTKLRYKKDLEDGSKVYYACLEPTEAGIFHYFAKVSTDNGETYTESEEATFNAVVDAVHTTTSSVIVLKDIEVESNLASLSWTAEGDNISGFNIFRKKVSDGGFSKIATLADTVNSYVDYTVSNDTEYIYKIAAFDEYYNRSYSEEKSVTPKLVMIDVTLRLHLPAYTPSEDDICIAGNFNGWNSSSTKLHIPSGATNRDVVEYSFSMMAGKSIEYKYTRGSWDTEAFTSHTRVQNDTEDYGNWAYSSTDTNMKLTIKNQGGNKMMVDDYVLRWVDMPMIMTMPRISYGEDVQFETQEDSFTLKAEVPYGVAFTINNQPIANADMDEYGHVYKENIPLSPGTNVFALHIEPTQETLNQPWYTDKSRAEQATKTITLTITTPEPSTPSDPSSPSSSDDSEEDDTPSDEEPSIIYPMVNAEGKISVKLPEGDNKVLLSPNANAINKNNELRIKSDKIEVTIQGQTLEALKSLLTAAELSQAHIVYRADALTIENTKQLVEKATIKSKAELKVAGDVYDFDLAIVDKSGKEHKLNKFKEPIHITLNVSESANKELVGVYYIADDGSMEYVGGKLTGNKITVCIDHFSKYAVLEYNKSFTDVSKDYWAYDVIKKMAAQQIVTGINHTEFAPLKPVTRAEFTAMIVRACGLQASKEVPFIDVETSQWYASAISAAYEAGIVSGLSSNTFAPNETITREEMAVITVRAFKVLTGKEMPSSIEAGFPDETDISSWAKKAVQSAYELGLIQGNNHHAFVPQGEANRAESVQVISNLLDGIQ